MSEGSLLSRFPQTILNDHRAGYPRHPTHKVHFSRHPRVLFTCDQSVARCQSDRLRPSRAVTVRRRYKTRAGSKSSSILLTVSHSLTACAFDSFVSSSELLYKTEPFLFSPFP